MIDEQVQAPAPRPARVRSRPAPRTQPAPPHSEDQLQAMIARAVAEAIAQERAGFLDRIEQLEQDRVASQFIESEPDAKVAAREAAPEEMTEFVAAIRAQTAPTPTGYQQKVISYNYPERLFCKPDGSVVSLQGDPGNRSYYQDKGYKELSDAQVKQWYGGERQKVIAIQREKAEIINTLRELVLRDPNLKASISRETEMAWDAMSVAELSSFRDEVLGIPDANGKPRRKLRPPERLIQAENRKAQAEADRMLAGVETTPPPSRVRDFEKLQEELRQGAPVPSGSGRIIEVAHGPRTFS